VLYLFWASKSYPKLPRKPKSGLLSYLPLQSPVSRPGGIPTKKQKKEKKGVDKKPRKKCQKHGDGELNSGNLSSLVVSFHSG
jgi:hypothetical protein